MKELNKKINELEKLLKEAGEKKVEYHVTIEQVDIKDPVLENLTFRLDSLDIKELSGALNLGNNLGGNVKQSGKEKTEIKSPVFKSETKKPGPGEKNSVNTKMQQNKTGYSFKFNTQEKKER